MAVDSSPVGIIDVEISCQLLFGGLPSETAIAVFLIATEELNRQGNALQIQTSRTQYYPLNTL